LYDVERHGCCGISGDGIKERAAIMGMRTGWLYTGAAYRDKKDGTVSIEKTVNSEKDTENP